jgi:hypothetical protein
MSDAFRDHLDLGTILNSFAAAWELKAEGPRAEIVKINAKHDAEIEAYGVPVASEQNVTLSPLPPCRAAVQGSGGSGRTLEQMTHQPSSVGAEVLEWLVGVIRPLGGWVSASLMP